MPERQLIGCHLHNRCIEQRRKIDLVRSQERGFDRSQLHPNFRLLDLHRHAGFAKRRHRATNILQPGIELVRRRHVLRLCFLQFDQPSLYLNCRFTEFSTTGFLILTLNPALFDRGREPLDMAHQRLNACDRILLLLLNPLEIMMTMLTGCPDFLRHQLRLRESLLEPLHIVIDLPHPFAHTTEPGFLAGLLRHPLCKLRFAGAHLLLKPLRFRRASLRITHQCIDPLGQISQHMLESGFVFPQ